MQIHTDTLTYDEARKLMQELAPKNEDKTNVLPQTFINDIIKRISTKHISDSISIPIDEAEILSHFWKTKDSNNMCPVDLIMQQTIPLPYIEISITRKDKAPIVSQVIIFENDIFEYTNRDGTSGTIIGVLIYKVKDNTYKNVIPLAQLPYEDYLVYLSETIEIHDNGEIISFDPQDKTEQRDFVSYLLTTWYGIQISLLHPTLKELMAHGKNIPRFDSTRNLTTDKNKKKRITYNVRTHYIKNGTIQNILKIKDKREFKTLAWYVIGHWRNYKDGKHTFIHGYWKGPLREMKQNLDKGRERRIDISNIPNQEENTNGTSN